MGWVVVDGLLGGLHGCAVHGWFSCAQVAADAGVRAAGNLQTQPVAGLELVGGGSHINFQVEAAVWLGVTPAWLKAQEAITNVEGTAVPIHIA